MANFFSKMVLKSSYKSVYGDKAIITVVEDKVEVTSGNRKVIHDKETTKKIEETFYEDNKVRIVKYDENGKADLEETYVNGKKVTEKKLGDGKSTSVDVNENGLEVISSVYFKDNVEYKENTYKYHNKITGTDCTIINIENDNEILKSIVKKKGEEVLVDVQKKMNADGRVVFYKLNDLEIEVEYFKESKLVKRYSRHWEEPIYEEMVESNPKQKKQVKEPKEEVRKQIGTKIKREIIEYNEKGKIIHLETDAECIHREFDDEGNLKKQYNILEGEHGKEIVGKLITEDKDIKIINNSTIDSDRIVKLNEEMDILEFRYEDNLVMMYDFMFWDGGIEVTEEYYQINSKSDLRKRAYEKIENNVDYHIEETYKNNALQGIRTINKVSHTELYAEGTKRFIKGFDGVEKEVTEDEYELYKMADALNKI